jgi:ABC-type sugar transport system ATPase subunit
MGAILLEGVSKAYAAGRLVLGPVDLSIDDGEFLVLVGPSGCGKSTLLRLIAGLESPTAGRVSIGGRDVTSQPPQARDLAMVFQSYALYPHMTVRRNLAYGLEVRRVAAAEIAARVERVAARLGIEPLLDRRPAQLSGGERQRVALGRAIVRQPQAFLFDEPLSNLDPALRARARAELQLMERDLRTTTVYVTHDQEEAMTLGHRVAVMRSGRIEQAAPPLEIYDRPANLFVAGFVGAPAMNMVPSSILESGPPGTIIGIRPHDLVIGRAGTLPATVVLVEPRGHDALVHLRVDVPASPSLVAVVSGMPPAIGEQLRIGYSRDRTHLFRESDGARIEI